MTMENIAVSVVVPTCGRAELLTPDGRPNS